MDKLVESHVLLQNAAQKGGGPATLFNGYATQQAADYAEMAIKSEDGRFMVDIVLTGKIGVEELQKSLPASFQSLEITAIDPKYRKTGIIEGWVSVEEAAALSQVRGVRSVFLALKPHTSAGPLRGTNLERAKEDKILPTTNLGMLGTKFLQGVTQHRVDKINQFYNPSAPVNYDGEGITVGVMSDSFDVRVTGTSAAINMANFDLPGADSNPINKTPVLVLQDLPGNSDEGRGMAEIVYKMAPKARIGFATAFTGEVGFANNIRALSGQFPAVPNTKADFKADVIVDDVGYGGEPIFADGGVIANGVDDVAAAGVSYFSSAANSYGVGAYNSDLRMIANGNGLTAQGGNSALTNTNIDLTGVSPDLYQGGFHNFNPNGQDVACTWNVSPNGIGTEMQWDDPYDAQPPNINQPPIFTGQGTASATPVDFTGQSFNATPQQYVIFVTAKPDEGTDAVVSLIRESDSRVIARQDTGTDEIVNFFPPTAGIYTIRVEQFDANSGGGFDITVYTGNGSPLLTTDLNLLVFRLDTGAFIGTRSLTSNNFANNRPVELGTVASPTGQTQVQFVIARSTIPTTPQSATHVRCSTASNSNPNNAPAEYYDYNSAVTGGHQTAAGANGVAAYEVFKPNVPQNFTSAGPALIYFDKNNNRLPRPEVRLQPRIAAANGANSTWITGDSANDVDTGGGQFYGTSASAPHAAGIAALVLDAHGGPGSITSAQMTSILQRSTFPHDLDPYSTTGVARATNGGKVTVTVRSDNTAPTGQSRGRNDPNSFTVGYIGPSAITGFRFNPMGLNTEGGGVTSGQNGVDANNNYFFTSTPGLYFAIAGTGGTAFTPGTLKGLNASDVVTPVLDAPAPAPAPAGNGRRFSLSFLNDNFNGGDVLRFTIGRGLERGPNVSAAGAVTANSSADLFGGGVLIPEGTVIQDGMRFSGTMADGATFDGRMRNRLGSGYSTLDGFGFINAEAAVSTPIQEGIARLLR